MLKLIIFHASWCGPCKAYDPIVKKLVEDHPEVEVEEYDVDSEDPKVQELIASYAIRSVPTTIIQDGVTETKEYGLLTKDKLEELLGL